MDLGQWLQISAASDSAWLIRHYYKRILFFGILGLLASVAWVQFNPDTYVSRAQVRFIPPQVAERYVTSNVAMQIDQRIFALTQLVNSRLTATKMIENFGLYSERRVFSTIADLVPRFQRDLQMRAVGAAPSEGTGRTVPSIQISFQYSDPAKAQKVVQRVVELIYEENRRYRGEQSMGTTEFLQQEVKKVLDQLTELEAKITTLPGNGTGIATEHLMEVDELHQLDGRLGSVLSSLRSVSTERTMKKTMLAVLEGQYQNLEKQNVAPTPTPSGDRARDVVFSLRAKAEEARNRYVPGQADRETVEVALGKAESELAKIEEREMRLSREAAKQSVQVQLDRARAELQGLDAARQAMIAEESQLTRQVRTLRSEVRPAGANSELEMERLVLMREYSVLKDQYTELTKKQRESQVASNMERRGQGETAELIEPPTMPESAEQPVRQLRIALGTISGLLFGMMMGLLSFLRRPRIRTLDHLLLLGDLPLFAELPSSGPLTITDEKRSRFRLFGASAATTNLMVLLMAGTLAMYGCSFKSVNSLLARGEELAAKGDHDGAVLLFKQVLKQEPKHGMANYRLGISLLETGQAGPARERLIRAAELLPDRREVQVKLAELTYQIYFGDPGRPSSILREVEDLSARLIERWPKSADGYRLKSQVLLEQRRSEEALEVLEKAIKKEASDPPLEAQLSAAYYSIGDHNKAAEILRHLLEANKDFGPGYDLLYLQLMERHNASEAVAVLEKKAQNIKNMQVALQLAAHISADGDHKKTVLLVNDAVRQYASDELAQARAGDFWMHRAQFDMAKQWYESGKAANAKSRNIYAARLMDMEFAKKNPTAAKMILEAELKIAPNDPLLNAYQAAFQLESEKGEDRTKAKARLESILTKMPNSPFVRLHLGRAYLQTGDLIKAGQQFERTVALDPNYAPGWIALAESDLMAGHAGLAQDRLAALLRRAPDYTPALILQAKTNLARKRPADAEKSLTKLLESQPNDVEALITMATAKASLQQNGKALEMLKRAQELLPNDARPVLMAAQLEASTGAGPAALIRLESARKRFPNSAEIRALYASVALYAHQEVIASAEYKSLAEQFPKNVEYRLGYANALGLSGKSKEAAEEYKRIQTSGGDGARAWLNYAVLMATAGDQKQAKSAYIEAIKRDKNNPYALNNLAYLMARNGEDLQAALHYAEDAKRSLPQSTVIHDTLTYIYLSLGMTRNASAILEEMMQWQPEEEKGRTKRVLAMLARGEVGKVRSEMEQAAVN